MKKLLCLLLLAGFLAATVVAVRDAEARPPCPPGYFWDGPRGCMPMPYYPPPPPAYYPPPVYVQPACPPGTFWSAGACRPVPPPPAPGVRVYLPPIYIGP
jgi:hypothetical protein